MHEEKITEIEYELAKKDEQLICGDCLSVFTGKMYYLRMSQPDKGDAMWAVVQPTKDRPARCPKCMKRRADYAAIVSEKERKLAEEEEKRENFKED